MRETNTSVGHLHNSAFISILCSCAKIPLDFLRYEHLITWTENVAAGGRRAIRRRFSETMSDLLMMALVGAAFALAAGYARFCDGLVRRPAATGDNYR